MSNLFLAMGKVSPGLGIIFFYRIFRTGIMDSFMSDREIRKWPAISLRQQEFEGETDSQPNHKITFSIGVASFPSDAVFKNGLLKAADAALHRAIESGGNTVSL